MTLRIVTDSVSDIPQEVVKDLNITVIPLLLRFGDETYRDGVDMTPDAFYKRLVSDKVFPSTSVPPPFVFAETYDRLAKEADEILVITLGAQLSGTHSAARHGTLLMKEKPRIEVVDSELATMAEGFVVIAAARMAKEGASLKDVIPVVKRNMKRAEIRAVFRTLEYLRRGGRIGKAQLFLGSLLKVNPVIALKDGQVEPITRLHSRAKVIDYLYNYVATTFKQIDELAVEDVAAHEEAQRLKEKLGSLFPKERIYRTQMTPVIGAHVGPGLLLVAVLGDKK